MSLSSLPSFTHTYHTTPYPAINPSRPALSHADRTILITGAGTGIGAAIGLAYALAGARHIILTGRRVGKLEEVKADILRTLNASVEDGTARRANLNVSVSVYSLDVTQSKAVEDVFGKCGCVDVVVHCAGNLEQGNKIVDGREGEFWEAMEVNVRGGWCVASAFLRSLKRGNEGDGEGKLRQSNTGPEEEQEEDTWPPVFIALNSFLAHLPASGVSTAPASYAVSKIALAKLVEYVAAENQHVRAYNVHPGIVETEMSRKSLEQAPEGTEVDWEDERVAAGFVVWLSSQEGEQGAARRGGSGRYFWSNWDVEELKERFRKGEFEEQGNEGLLRLGLGGWGDRLPEKVE